MAKLGQVMLEAVIANGKQHTYASLCEIYHADGQQAMQIDRTLQKLRKKGLIAFTRKGRTVIWQAVPKPYADGQTNAAS